MTQSKEYTRATEVDGGLYAVQLRDGGWSVAEGPHTALYAPAEPKLARRHLPVRFESEAAAAMAIHSGPHEVFDIKRDSAWTRHCLAAGGVACEAYGW